MKRHFKGFYACSIVGYSITLVASFCVEYITNVTLPLNVCLVCALPFTMLCAVACGIHARLPQQDQIRLEVSRIALFADHPYCMLARMGLGNLFGIISLIVPEFSIIIWLPIGIGLVAVDLTAFAIVKQREKKERELAKEHRKLHQRKRRR